MADAVDLRELVRLGQVPTDPLVTVAGLRTLGGGPRQAASGDHLHDARYSQLGHTHLAAQLGNSGTRDATTVLHGDNAWRAPARPAALGFYGYQTVAQNLAANTWIPILLDAEIEDTDNGHSTSTNTSRYVCQRAGLYVVSGVLSVTHNQSIPRYGAIARNGSAIPGSVGTSAVTSGTTDSPTGEVPVRCAVNDYVELWGYVTAACSTSTATLGGVPRDCSLTVVYLGP